MQLKQKSFLTAEWRTLAMLNYELDPALLAPLVPAGTELDLWNHRCLVSVVGFLFLDTRLRGIPIPFHRNFEEVNLRFYVRHQAGSDCRRGVVFVKEIVPRFAIAAVARWRYNENYQALPMHHSIDPPTTTQAGGVRYAWKANGRWQSLSASLTGDAREVAEASEEAFITEHYWGYVGQRNGATLEYRVDHPRWRVWTAREAALDCDVESLYGARFVEPLARAPTSAFVAEGSAVTVHRGRRI